MSNTYCMFKRGPADGLMIPTADHACTRRIVIYRHEGGSSFAQPAVYKRDETDQGDHQHTGMDGVVRTSPTLGYVFERYVTPELAAKIEKVRQTEQDDDAREGWTL